MVHLPRPRPLTGFRYYLERFLLRGAQYRLLFMAAVVGLLSLVAGVLVLPSDAFDSLPDAAWWAFLRLSDPGYLGDDEGTFIRVVSTALTMAGYVLFLGSLVAIMTQWLNATMIRLEQGLTPVSRQGHVVILGWTNRTVPIVRELLLSSDRVRRFLLHRGARSLQVVILVEEVTAALRQEMRDQLGPLWDEGRITLRSGSSLRVEHLDRVDFLRAGVILVPGSDLVGTGEGSVALDTRTVKTLLSVDQAAGEREVPRPQVVAEIHDSRKVGLARRSYRGPAEFVASDAVLARLVAQTLRHPGLSRVYGELLAQDEGNELYMPEAGALEGLPVEALGPVFPRGVVLGLVRTEGDRTRPILAPPEGTRVEAGDRILVMARSWAEVQEAARRAPGTEGSRGGSAVPGPPAATPGDAEVPGGTAPEASRPRRILLLGWSRKVPALLREFSTYRGEAWEVDVLSRVDAGRRVHALERVGLPRAGERVRQLEGDFTVHGELVRVQPLGYDGIVLVGGDAHGSGEEADARTLLGALLLRELAEGREGVPPILVELLDPAHRDLMEGWGMEVLVTPILVSHVLAQVALRPELRAVFDALFTAGGPEIGFLPAASLGVSGRVGFGEVAEAARRRGSLALGVRMKGGAPLLNPAGGGPGGASRDAASGAGSGAASHASWDAEGMEVVALVAGDGERASP
jgi:ion channel POLLUX/CASTOR